MSKKKSESPLRQGLYEHGTALVHSSLHEFVMSHRPGDTGLYPLLNHIILTVQRPVLLVVFKRPVAEVIKNPNLRNGWVHSFPYPNTLREKLDKEIERRLKMPKASRALWIFEVEGIECDRIRPENNLTAEMYGIGILYLHIGFRKEGSAGLAFGASQRDEPLLEPLQKSDRRFVSGLFESIQKHEANSIPSYKLHFHHISHYWVHARDSEKRSVKRSVFDIDHKVSKDSTTDLIDENDVQRFLRPVFQEIDAIYRELRGGEPGKYEAYDKEIKQMRRFNTRTEAGVSMLFSRHREAQSSEEGGIRSPTIAFFLKLRLPMKNRRKGTKEGFRIVPIVTRAMAQDLAAVLVDYRNRQLVKNSERTNGRKLNEKFDKEFRNYLLQMNAEVPPEKYTDDEAISERIFEGLQVTNFLKDQAHHSITFPAFSSGLMTFLPAKSCSIVDRYAIGPSTFLLDEKDAAFIKPIFVSGSAVAAVMTKSRTDLSRGKKQNFDACYYNYSFYRAVIGRLLSRRIRRAMSEAYLRDVSSVVFDKLTTEGYGLELKVDQKGKKTVFFDDSMWSESVNVSLRQLAQVFPFAKIILTFNDEEAFAGSAEMGGFRFDLQNLGAIRSGEPVPDVPNLFFYIANNDYYSRKLVAADERFLGLRAVKSTLINALGAARHYWRQHDKLKS